MIGAVATHTGIEEAVVSTIADQCGGGVEPGWMVPEMLDAATEVAAVNLVPTNRHIALENLAPTAGNAAIRCGVHSWPSRTLHKGR